MKLANAKEVIEYVDTIEKSAESMRLQLAERQGIDGCYYEGVQWITRGWMPGVNRSGNITRLTVDYNPNSQHLRVIANDTTRLTQKSAASTHPSEIYMKVWPPERDSGPDAAYRARVHESLVNAAIDSSGYLSAAQDANDGRCIFGTRLIGLSIERVEGGSYLCAFDAETTGLILEPTCQKRNLHDHPHVCFSDVWTLDRIEKVLGVKIPPDRAKTFEQIDPQKVEMNALSGNKMFTRYARYSKAKGARVYQLHTKDGDRFPDWFVLVEDGNGTRTLVNEDDTATPFGGMGMPFAMLHGYRRADTMWSWGEPAQIMEDQNRNNLRATTRERIVQQYAHARPLVDRRWFGSQSGNDDDIIKQFSNKIGQPIIGSGSDRARNAQPPGYMQMPPPPPFLDEAIERGRETMREKTHKAPGNFGVAKTHVPDATNERVLDDADQVSSKRVGGDVMAHNYLIGVLHATTIKMVQEKNLPTIAMLRKEGFDGQDFSVVLTSEPGNPGVRMAVKEGSFRNVSNAARKANLDNAATMGMIDAETYQQAMAESLQMPLDDERGQMIDFAQKAALNVLHGQDWIPKPFGRWNTTVIEAFIRAQTDRLASDDPAVAQRLVAAIQSQKMIAYQEQLLDNPELAAKAQAQPATEPEGDESAGPQPGQSASVTDILAHLQSGGAGVSAQPASAA